MYQDTQYGVAELEVTEEGVIDLDLGEGCSLAGFTQEQAAHLAAKLSYFAVTGKLPE